MEHPCVKCGAAVEEGAPFCPQCNAPQIRVQSAVTSPATPPMPPGTPDEVQPPAEPLSHAAHQPRPPALPPAPPRDGLNRRSKYNAALWAGAIAGAGALVPFMPFIVLCMIAAGGMSIAFYTRREPTQNLTAGNGFRLGSLAGLFGFLINGAMSALAMLSASTRAALRDEMGNRLKEAMASNTADPKATEMMRRLGEQLNTPEGLAILFTFALAVLGVFFVVFGGLGGAIGATLFGRNQQPEQH